MEQPRQQSLFGDETSEPDLSDLVEIRAKEAPLSKQQRTFNRLSADLERQRRTLARWQEFLPRLLVRFEKELKPLADDLRGAKRELLMALSRRLVERNHARGVPKRFRARVEVLAVDIAHDLLVDAEEGDPEVERIYKKLTGSTIEEHEAAFKELFSAVAEDLGMDVDVDDLEALLEQNADTEPKRRQKAPSKKAAEADKQARLSVRQIHRSLATRLHPDRERDAAERDRKTRLMQRANDAYHANDIRELLALQIETDELESTDLAEMADERIATISRGCAKTRDSRATRNGCGPSND